MKLLEIEREARALNERERAQLVSNIMDTLVAPDTEILDEEVIRRDDEMENGNVTSISHEEMTKRVQDSRRQ